MSEIAGRLLVWAIGCALLAWTGTAPAQVARAGQIHVLSGFSAGVSSDAVARLLAERFDDGDGHPAIVENRPGAGGRIAAVALKRAPPDGRTLLMAPVLVSVIAPLVFRNLDYDPTVDFAPVAHVADYDFALVVAADHPARDLAEFVRWARAHGNEVAFATGGAGSLPHFLGVSFGRETGLAMVHVPYQGAVAAIPDLTGGRVTLCIAGLSDVVGLARAGSVRVLATTGTRRSPQLPGVPTVADAGFPRLQATGWIALYAPAHTPYALRTRYAAIVAGALAEPAVRARLETLGLTPSPSTPEELAAIEARDRARWAPVIAASGFVGD